MKDDRILCEVSEKGKIVVNRCLDMGYHINTLKLENLLIIMHGMMLSKYNNPFFKAKIIAESHSLIIPSVDDDFLCYAVQFKEKFVEYICLLSKEEEILNYVINNYGSFNTFELEQVRKELSILRKLCYKNDSDTMIKLINEVPNELIKNIFDNYKYNNQKDKLSIQKTLKKIYINDN